LKTVISLPAFSARSLRIHDIDPSDYGEYKCVASNPLGIDQQVMYLYGRSSSLYTLTSGSPGSYYDRDAFSHIEYNGEDEERTCSSASSTRYLGSLFVDKYG